MFSGVLTLGGGAGIPATLSIAPASDRKFFVRVRAYNVLDAGALALDSAGLSGGAFAPGGAGAAGGGTRESIALSDASIVWRSRVRVS